MPPTLLLAMRTFCFLLPVLLVLPFDPQWPDFERARRGALLVIVGAGLVACGLRARRPAAPLLWLLALAAAALASTIWAHDPLSALEQGAYLTGLFALPLLLPSDAAAGGAFRAGVATVLLVTSVYGIAQSLGLDWPAGYTVPHEPVATLGNRNVASEWTATAAPLALGAHPLVGWLSVAAADMYLWTNGGRAGLVAFHLGLLVFCLMQRAGRKSLALLLICTGGAIAGRPIRVAPPPDPILQENLARAGLPGRLGDTLEVRLRTWPRTLEMTVDELPLGVGAGNFVARFPQYRDPKEIEISSFGHEFGSRVKTPHNDLLHILAELGLVGGAILVLFGCAVAKTIRGGLLAPGGGASLAAFLLLAMFRSPLFNAPAAAACITALSLSLAPSRSSLPRAVRALARWSAIGPLGIGILVLIGEGAAACFLRAKSAGDPAGGAACLERAAWYDPFETDWILLRAQLHHQRGQPVPAGRLPQVQRDLAEVLERRPGEYRALLDVGYLGLAHPELRARGRRAVELVTGQPPSRPGLDPKHPVGLLLAANYACLERDWERAFEFLIRLRSEEALTAGVRLLRGFKERADDLAEKIEIAKRIVALRKLGRTLFPAATEFR